MEPELFLEFAALIIAAALAVKFKAVRAIILGSIAFAIFFLIGWGLL